MTTMPCVRPCTDAIPLAVDIERATTLPPPTEPTAGAEALAVRCDRRAQSRAGWARHCATALTVAERLRVVAERRAADVRYAEYRVRTARAEAQTARSTAEHLRTQLHEERSRRHDQANRMLAVIHRYEERDRAAARDAARKRAARKRAALADRCRALCGADDLTPTMRTGLRALVGATGSPPVRLVDRGAPRLVGEPGGHYTPGGDPVRSPTSYQRAGGRVRYVRSTEEVTVSAAWIRAHGPSIARAAVRGPFIGAGLGVV